jgi:CheY-like chemotaxis protein
MSRPTILCVDDDPLVLASLSGQLRGAFGAAYALETATSAEDALEVIEDLSAEGVRLLVIVSDWLMPGVRGDELLVRVHARHPEVVKVLITGQADDASVERARREGGLAACLHKPWQEADLVAVIQERLKA